MLFFCFLKLSYHLSLSWEKNTPGSWNTTTAGAALFNSVPRFSPPLLIHNTPLPSMRARSAPIAWNGGRQGSVSLAHMRLRRDTQFTKYADLVRRITHAKNYCPTDRLRSGSVCFVVWADDAGGVDEHGQRTVCWGMARSRWERQRFYSLYRSLSEREGMNGGVNLQVGPASTGNISLSCD